MNWKVKRSPAVEGELSVPGDKSISHRALLLAAFSNGPCKLTNLLEGEDCQATLRAIEQLGVKVDRLSPTSCVVHGVGGKFRQPTEPIDCGNSGTGMRILCGLLAGQPFETRLIGDASLSNRPMGRVIDPLTKMGARITAEGKAGRPPLVVEGGNLTGIQYELPVPSAQVKSAILLAGLQASGKTTVISPAPSRDHTERMLKFFCARPSRYQNTVSVYGGTQLESRDFTVPGDFSSAAFWLVAAAAKSRSRVMIKDVGLNPSRTGLLSALVRMRATIREVIESDDSGEPWGTLDVTASALEGTTVRGSEIPNLIDEIPILAVAAALAQGQTSIRDAAELRVKETDRIEAVVRNLQLMGVTVTEYEDGLVVEGGARLKGARVNSYGDHRIAMAFAILGLFASGETIVEDVECVNTSYPGFHERLQAFQRGKLKPMSHETSLRGLNEASSRT